MDQGRRCRGPRQPRPQQQLRRRPRVRLIGVVGFLMGFEHLDRTEVHFRKLAATALDQYVRLEQPFDCAGSFKSEGLGVALFERISSDDPTALIGLPLIWLAEALRAMGHRVEVEGTGIPFGGYQAIVRDPVTGVYTGATEMRKDGQASGY